MSSLYCPIRRGQLVWPYAVSADERLLEFDYDELVYETNSKWQNIRIYHSEQQGNALVLDGDSSERFSLYLITLLSCFCLFILNLWYAVVKLLIHIGCLSVIEGWSSRFWLDCNLVLTHHRANQCVSLLFIKHWCDRRCYWLFITTVFATFGHSFSLQYDSSLLWCSKYCIVCIVLRWSTFIAPFLDQTARGWSQLDIPVRISKS